MNAGDDGFIVHLLQPRELNQFPTGASPMTLEENKALVRRYFEEIGNQGNLTVVSEIVKAEAVADVQRLTTTLHIAFPDFHIVIEHQIAEGDLVATHFTASGTHTGEWDSPFGKFAPTGKHFVHEGIRLFRVENSRLVDTWGGADTLDQLQQLGIINM